MPTFQFPPYFTHDMTNLDLQKKLDTRGPRKCKHFVKLQVARVLNMEEFLPHINKTH